MSWANSNGSSRNARRRAPCWSFACASGGLPIQEFEIALEPSWPRELRLRVPRSSSEASPATLRSSNPSEPKEALLRARTLDVGNEAAWDKRISEIGRALDSMGLRGHAATERALGRSLPRSALDLSRRDSVDLERRLDEVPEDKAARGLLIGAYAVQALQAKSADRSEVEQCLGRLREHVGWLIDNEPRSKEAGDSGRHEHQRVDPAGYVDLAARWERQIEAHSDDAVVCGQCGVVLRER